MRKACVQDIENISSGSFCVHPVVPIRLGKVIKYEAKKTMPIIYLETLNIAKGQIDPKRSVDEGVSLEFTSVHFSRGGFI